MRLMAFIPYVNRAFVFHCYADLQTRNICESDVAVIFSWGACFLYVNAWVI